MDAKTVREMIIRPKLAEVFGGTITTVLITSAISAGMLGSTEAQKLELMVETICSDKRVVGMWGTAQARRMKTEWLALL